MFSGISNTRSEGLLECCTVSQAKSAGFYINVRKERVKVDKSEGLEDDGKMRQTDTPAPLHADVC